MSRTTRRISQQPGSEPDIQRRAEADTGDRACATESTTKPIETPVTGGAKVAAFVPDVVHCFVDPQDLQRMLGAMASAELASAVIQSALLAAERRARDVSA